MDSIPRIKRREQVTCDWCLSPGASHEGGFTYETLGDFSGHFCNKECFDFWVRWKSVFLEHLLKLKKASAQTNLPEGDVIA